jgi:hypothetical protein
MRPFRGRILVKRLEMAKYPISVACPKCRGVRYRNEKPEALVAFVPDRVCEGCNTRYTPPTPRWAGASMLVMGLIILVGLACFVLGTLRGRVSGGFPFELVFVSISLGIPGIAGVCYGFKHLLFPERPVDNGDQGPGTKPGTQSMLRSLLRFMLLLAWVIAWVLGILLFFAASTCLALYGSDFLYTKFSPKPELAAHATEGAFASWEKAFHDWSDTRNTVETSSFIGVVVINIGLNVFVFRHWKPR